MVSRLRSFASNLFLNRAINVIIIFLCGGNYIIIQQDRSSFLSVGGNRPGLKKAESPLEIVLANQHSSRKAGLANHCSSRGE